VTLVLLDRVLNTLGVAHQRSFKLAVGMEAARRHRSRALTVYHDDDGMVVIRGRLEPEAGALLLRALEAAREALGQPAQGAAAADSPANATPGAPLPADPIGAGPTVAQRQADALALLAETALDHGLDPSPSGERYQVVVHGASRKADAFSGSQSHRGKSQSPVAWMAGWRETETLKPIDQAIERMVSESPGRNESERRGGPETPRTRRPSLTVKRRRQHGSSHLADAAGHSGGVRATAR
jgi:hypothetical protein